MNAEQIEKIANMSEEELAKFKDLVAFFSILGVDKEKLAKFPTAIDNYESITTSINNNFTAIQRDIENLMGMITDINNKIRNITAPSGITVLSDLNGNAEGYTNGE